MRVHLWSLHLDKFDITLILFVTVQPRRWRWSGLFGAEFCISRLDCKLDHFDLHSNSTLPTSSKSFGTCPKTVGGFRVPSLRFRCVPTYHLSFHQGILLGGTETQEPTKQLRGVAGLRLQFLGVVEVNYLMWKTEISVESRGHLMERKK